ncbi:MAG: EscU/YscU/HrcU family type III secretion system export apparatus switch protein [Spirochaetes bacterium]|nr:EscU/YscU/HrcU family type III secretion system export apparatus switch protein [Spirochaetota bacterium]
MEDIAVALKYSIEDAIPKVIAKGKGKLAKSILDKAKEYNIPIYQDKDLAVVLSSLEPDSFIPENLYAAVAIVLAYCYRVNSDFRRKLN